MAGTDIEQLIPIDIMDALFGAASPSGSNVFATMADLIPDTDTNIYNTDNSLTGNRIVTGAGNSLTFSGIAEFTVTPTTTTNAKFSWTDGTGTPTTAVMGAGLSPTSFEYFGAATSYVSAPGIKGYGGLYEVPVFPGPTATGDVAAQWTVYDPAFLVDEAGFFASRATGGGNATLSRLYHWEYGTGNFYGFEANVFGERILSQSAGLNRLSALDVNAGMTFLSGSGGTGYIGVVDQTGLASWLGISTFSPTWANVLSNGNVSGGTNVILSQDPVPSNPGDYIQGSDGFGHIQLRDGGDRDILFDNDGGSYAKEGLYYADDFLSLFMGGWVSAYQGGTGYLTQYAGSTRINMRDDVASVFPNDRGINIASHKNNVFTTGNIVTETGPSINVAINSNDATLQANIGVGVSAANNVLLGGTGHTLNTGVDNSVVLGGSNQVISKNSTAYVTQFANYNSVSTFDTILVFAGATGSDKVQRFQDASGIIALTSDIPAGAGDNIYNTDGAIPAATTRTATIADDSSLVFTAPTFGTILQLDGATGKVTIPGLLDPVGLQLDAAVTANPGTANTFWSNQTDSNRPYYGANKLAYVSDLIPDTDTNIYNTNGTIGAGRVATITDTLTFDAGSVILQGSTDDETVRLLNLKNDSGVDKLYVTNDGRMKNQFVGNIDAGVAARNHVLQWDADVLERTGGDGYNVFQFSSSFAGANASNHYRTMYVTAPSGGANPTFGRYALYGDAFLAAGTNNNGVGVYGRAGNSTATQYGGWFQITGTPATSRNRAVYGFVQTSNSGAASAGDTHGGYFQGTRQYNLHTGTYTGVEGFVNSAGTASGIGTNIGGEFSAISGAINMAIRVQAGRGDVVIGAATPTANGKFTLRGADNSALTRMVTWEDSVGVDRLLMQNDGRLATGTGAALINDTTYGQLHRISGYQYGFGLSINNATTAGSVISVGGTTPTGLLVSTQTSTSLSDVTAIRGTGYSSSSQTNRGVYGLARNGSQYSIGVQGSAGGGASRTSTIYQAGVVGGAAVQFSSMTSYGGNFSAVYNNAALVITNDITGVVGTADGTAGAAGSTGKVIGGDFYTTGTTGTGDRIALRVRSTGNNGVTVLGANDRNGNAQLQVTGEMELFGNGAAFYMYSPDGTRWTVTMDNTGSFQIV